jgi:hypothetical protein
MNHLRNLDPRRKNSDQKMHQTTSVCTFLIKYKIKNLTFSYLQTITVNNSSGITVPSSNGNNEQEPRQKVSSLVFKFGGDRNKKVPTYTFSPGNFDILLIDLIRWILFS